MDAPATPPALPPTPPPLPPLGRKFVITLLAPLVPLIICILTALAGGSKDGSSLIFFFLALPVMLGCSIACAIQAGSRKGAGIGVLTFIGTQILYLSLAFAGCVASFSHMDFK